MTPEQMEAIKGEARTEWERRSAEATPLSREEVIHHLRRSAHRVWEEAGSAPTEEAYLAQENFGHRLMATARLLELGW